MSTKHQNFNLMAVPACSVISHNQRGAYQSARRGHVFHTLSYLYRKYVVYFGCQAHAPRASVLRERQRMRIHDNILRTRYMNVIVYGCVRFTINISATAKKVSGPGRGQGSQVHHITKIRI